MIARKLQEYLKTIAAIQNALSVPNYGVRIRVSTIPQNMPLPYVRLAEVGATVDHGLGGELSGLKKSVQVDVWAETETKAEEIAELIRGYDSDGELVAAQPLPGFLGTWDGTTIEAVTIESELGTYDDPRSGSDEPRYRSTRTYEISFKRPVS